MTWNIFKNYMLIGKLYIKVMPFKIDTCSNGNLPSLLNSCSCPFGGKQTSFHLLIQTSNKTNLNTLTVMKMAKIRNRYNQVPYLTQDTIWETDKIQENITHKRVKRSAFSPKSCKEQTRQYNKDKRETSIN